MAVSAHRVLAVALGALAALFAKSLCVSAGDVFGALAIPLHRSSIPLERVFGPVYNAPSEDMAWTLIQKMCGWSTGCKYMNVSGFNGFVPYLAVASNTEVAHMAWAGSVSAAAQRAQSVCGDDCSIGFTGQLNERSWRAGARFQALAVTYDDLWGKNGNVVSSAPGTQHPGGGATDPAAVFDDATHQCSLSAGETCYVAQYVTSGGDSYDCVGAAVCIEDPPGHWHRSFQYANSNTEAASASETACTQEFQSSVCSGDCKNVATTCA